MPPHCDSMDGPVVKAAIEALERAEVNRILPYVPKDAEGEVITTFEKVLRARKSNHDIQEVLDRHFFETVVRLHRAGEGAPYTGLKPAGLDVGPVIPVAEKALETGSADELIHLLSGMVEDEIASRFARVMDLKSRAGRGVDAAREYVESMLGIQVYAHKLYESLRSQPHEAHAGHHHA